MRCINALWFLCYNESVLLILWLQIVFVFYILELGLEMCFRINLPFSDFTWWHYNYLPAYMLKVSILWWRAFDCYVEATRSCVINVFELFPFWKVYHYLYCARFQYRNRNAAISFMTTSPSWKWMLLSIYFEYWKILRMERKSTEWTILSLYSEYYKISWVLLYKVYF